MGVAFYILFVLIASPVKREDACRTTRRQSKVVEVASVLPEPVQPAVPVTPTVTLEHLTAPYKYYQAITLKWSIQPPDQFQVTKINVKVFKGSNVVHEAGGECNGGSTAGDCLSYRILVKLDPGDYNVQLTVSVSKGGETQDIGDSGSFTVDENPAVALTSPNADQEYEKGEEVEVKWSITDPIVAVDRVITSIFNAESQRNDPDYTVVEKSDKTEHKFKSIKLGSYDLKFEVLFTDGTTLGDQYRSFKVFEVPIPKVNPSDADTFNQNKIVIGWSTEGPTDRIESYEILVWTLDSDKQEQGDPTSHPVTCTDIQECKESELRLSSGHYRCRVKLTTRNGQEKTSENYRDIRVRSRGTSMP